MLSWITKRFKCQYHYNNYPKYVQNQHNIILFLWHSIKFIVIQSKSYKYKQGRS